MGEAFRGVMKGKRRESKAAWGRRSGLQPKRQAPGSLRWHSLERVKEYRSACTSGGGLGCEVMRQGQTGGSPPFDESPP